MILVAGGTGRLGTLVVARLCRRGPDVRVLTRDRDARHAHLARRSRSWSAMCATRRPSTRRWTA